VELSDEELSLPNQESRFQPPLPELSLELVPESPPPALWRRSPRFCTRFVSRKQISDVPPTAAMNAAIPPIIVSSVKYPRFRVSAHRNRPVRPISSPRQAGPFIDHSSEIWNFAGIEP
jgi:hypothetical protein